LFGSVLQIKLATRQLLGAHCTLIYSIVLYRITQKHEINIWTSAMLRDSRPGVQSASLIMTSLMTS